MTMSNSAENGSGPIHWVGDAPTSLHGNGAASFDRTTRDEHAVTCRLCLTLLGRAAITNALDAGVPLRDAQILASRRPAHHRSTTTAPEETSTGTASTSSRPTWPASERVKHD